MSNEEMDKKMEFIVEHQARFAAEIEIMREVQAADAKLFKEEMELLKEQTRDTSAAIVTIVGIVGTLTESQRSLVAAQKTLAEAQKNLAEAEARTEERLNIFINVVERYMSGNGGSELRT
jgi:hypothetical protein